MSDLNEPKKTVENDPGVNMPKQEALTSSPSAPQTEASPGVSFLTAAVISALLAAFSGFISWHFATNTKQQAPAMAMVDAAKLVEIQAKQALNKPGMTTEDAAKEGKDFVIRLDQALEEYTQAGIVVVNSSVVLNRPAQIDVTAQVAQKLGLKLD